MRFESEGARLHRAVTAARAKLVVVESKHDRLLAEGSLEVRDAGLAYAQAVHDYSNLVMKWLAWIARNGNTDAVPAEDSSNSAVEG
jgi:hypothetical protein